jgi:cytochrome oxidase Cu insertion factor (SCO1/SenC/PrrC family)
MNGDLLGFASAALSIGAWAYWMRLMQAVKVPRDRTAFLAVMGVGVVLGIGAFIAGTGIFGGIAAGLGLFAGAMYLGLRLQSAQDKREPAVALGQPMLAFSAPDDSGATFDSAALAGKPYLLKFFRGHW